MPDSIRIFCVHWGRPPAKFPLTAACAPLQVRDSLGLTYDVSFELSLFDRLSPGWFVVNVTSTPQKIHEALNASVSVLRSLAVQRISPRDLVRAQRTLLTRHESDTKVGARMDPLLPQTNAAVVNESKKGLS